MTKHVSNIVQILFAALVIPLTASGGNWDHFRGGMNLDGNTGGGFGQRPVKKWSVTVGKRYLSSPVGRDGLVYIGGVDGNIRAFDLANGNVRWAFDTGHAIEASAFVQGNQVVVGNGKGRLVGLDRMKGSLNWSANLDGAIMGSANGPRSGNDLWFALGCYDHRLYQLGPTGVVRWFFETEEYVHGSPALEKGRLVMAGCDGYVRAFSSDGKALAAVSVGSYVASSPAVRGDTAWLGTYAGSLFAVDLAAGKVLWQASNTSGAGFFSSPALSADLAIFGCRDNYVYGVELKTGKIRWKSGVAGGADASPVLCGEEVIVVSLEGVISSLKVKNGAERWTYDLGGRVSGSPMVMDRCLVVAMEQGSLWCLESKP